MAQARSVILSVVLLCVSIHSGRLKRVVHDSAADPKWTSGADIQILEEGLLSVHMQQCWRATAGSLQLLQLLRGRMLHQLVSLLQN